MMSLEKALNEKFKFNNKVENTFSNEYGHKKTMKEHLSTALHFRNIQDDIHPLFH